jgi:DEAD/DEAH box helicase domain-containing protein
MFEVIFDLETKKFFDDTGTSDPADLGVSIISLYHREIDNDFNEVAGKMLSFWENDFPDMWKLFFEADRIIGFNTLHFDVPALRPYAPSGFAKLPHFDILAAIKEEFGKRVKLNAIAKDTLGETKIDSGSNAIMYWNSGDADSLAKLRKYCEADVDITKKIYDFGLKNKYVKFTDYWNTERKVAVDFSYPEEALQKGTQGSLF